jgi:uncharacterized protein YjiS (DUF1127 family)
MRPQLLAVCDEHRLEETMSHAVSNELPSSRSGSAIRSVIDAAAAWIRSTLAAAVKLWIARRDERILMQAAAHQLRDLGIERADIRRAVRTGRLGCG